MFGHSQSDLDKAVEKAKNETEKKVVSEWSQKSKEDRLGHDLVVRELKGNHDLELKEKEFELKHNADERVKKAEEKATSLAQELAVAKKENEMLGKITDLNADVIDVKKLVGDLINKLPNVNITAGISTAGPSKGGKEGGKQE